MLSSLKKPSDKASAVTVPAWHPNFRNFERLPDTKVVRTSFFINGVAVVIALMLGGYTIYREYTSHELRGQNAYWDRESAVKKPASDQAIALYKKFQEEEKQIFALRDFKAGTRLVISDFLLNIGETLPQGVMLNSFDYKAAGVTLRGSIAGLPDEASGKAAAYLDSLRKYKPFAGLFDSITLANIVRDNASGNLKFEIYMKFKPVVVAK